MKKSTSLCGGLFLIFISCNFLATPHLSAQSSDGIPVVPKIWQTEPFRNEVFIENKGQFEGLTGRLAAPVLYGTDNGGYQVLFTDKGVTWKFDVAEKMTPEEERVFEENHKKFEEHENEAEEEHLKYTIHPVLMHMEWVNANANPLVVAEDVSPSFFNFADPRVHGQTITNCKGYRKLIYKNIYPGIDIAYVFKNDGKNEGIKYSVIVHPGADPSVVKMKYSGATVFTDANGLLHIHNDKTDDLTETAPYTFYSSGGGPITSVFHLENNVVSFTLGSYDSSREIVIDPFQIVPVTVTADMKCFDVERDAAGNVYVAGGFNNYKVAKYDAAGVNLWTFSTPFGALFSWGDLTVDPAGNAYAMCGFPTGSILKLNPGGALVWDIATGNLFEHFNWDFNCNFSQLILSSRGAGLGQLSFVNTATGAITGTTMVSNSEIRSMTIAPDGTIYALTCLTLTSAVGNFLLACTPTFAPTAFNSIGSGYAWQENGVTYGNGQTILGPGWQGQNGIASDNCFIYTTNGSLVEKRNKTTGAVIVVSPVPGGVPENNSGIAVDDCGNVYVGSQGGVYKFDNNLTLVTFAPTGNPVYCVSMGLNGEILASGIAFVAAINMNACQPILCATNLTFTTVNPACFGSTGSATAILTGAAGPFTYAWSNGAVTQTATNLAPGPYTCTVTSGCGATVSGSVTITAPGSPTITLASQTNVSCAGGNNGAATITGNGGNLPYTYAWSPSGGNAATASNLTAGIYTCTLTDASGCTATFTVTITQPSAITATTSSVPTTCGNNTGTATVNPSGGNPGYTYLWSDGQTTQTAVNLNAGVFTCAVTDATSCTQNFTVTVSNSNGPTATLSAQQDVTCNGGNDGSAGVTVSGGTPPYLYAWTSGGTAAIENNLAAGNYVCTVTDDGGCTQAVAVTITEPPAFSTSGTSTQATCGASNGSATISVSGGTPPYTYQWSSSGTNATENNLAAGTYTVVITDNLGCITFDSVTVTQPASVAASASVINVSCNGGSNGSATANPSGGTAPYTYSWAPTGGTSQTATSLAAGTFVCTVTDNTGCSIGTTVTITEPPAITLAPGQSDLTCFGSNDGSAWVVANGGTLPYIFTWAPLSGSNDSITNKPAGSYTITITDANGCAVSDSVSLSEPAEVEVWAVTPVNICQGQAVTMSAPVTGGNPGYTMTWNPGGPTVSPATTTLYTVTATDANGCVSDADSILVIVNPPLVISAISPPGICAGGTAGLSASASGGDGNFTFNWSPLTTPATGPNVSASPTVTTTYTVVVTDGCGSTADSAFITITVYPAPQPAFALSDSSGCAPFCVTFNNLTTNSIGCVWQFGDGGSDTAYSSVAHCYSSMGTFDVALTVTDANGCTGTIGTAGLVIVFPTPTAGFTFVPIDATVLDPEITFNDASLNGTQWSWNFGDGPPATTSTSQNPTFTYPLAGIFTVQQIVSNAFGCADTTEMAVSVEEAASFYIPNAFSPNNDGINDVFMPQGSGIDANLYELWIFDRWGNLVYHTTTWGEGWDGTLNGNLCQQEVYVWRLSYENTVQKKTTVRIGHVSLMR
ncbi:MAG TPA: PKD domain-containing protein [Bacteroidia bacterium]|nr:PKD domain-containing protein [Bacteroidia bacterium]